MADRSRNRNRRIQSNRWDDGHINNWTTQRYIEELAKLGIRVPSNIGKVVLKKLYLENQGMPPANSSDAVSISIRETGKTQMPRVILRALNLSQRQTLGLLKQRDRE